MHNDPTVIVNQVIVPIVNRVRAMQDDRGRVIGEETTARRLLDELRPAARGVFDVVDASGQQAAGFELDLDSWLARGLTSPPEFDYSVQAFRTPGNHEFAFFIGPTACTNSEPPIGKRLECFLAFRQEPEELDQVSRQLPHPGRSCQSTRIRTGSEGFLRGNCLVFFPENVATQSKAESQSFAVFFFNKFFRLYHHSTLRHAARLLPGSKWYSAALTAEDCYRARCLWGYLHDRQHHLGPRPLHLNLQVKMNWFVGVLEELKVDCQTAELCLREGLPFGREIAEFILLERLLRYPARRDATRNFDAATGVLLFEWLRHSGLSFTATPGYAFDLERCVLGMAELASHIERLEYNSASDEEYRYFAYQFIRRWLPEGVGSDRFSMPRGVSHFLKEIQVDPEAAVFDPLPY